MRHCWVVKNESSLLEVLKTGRGVQERQRAWKRAAVGASIERSPMKSTWKQSSELGVPQSTMRDHMKKDLNVRPYRPTFMNELSDGDMDQRYESCRALLDTFSNAPTYVTEDMEAHPFVCPASRCTYGSTGQVTKCT